jgi:Lrp/AsnC family transcriptional regulator, leucine-responsive regulatory protein
MPDSTKIGTTDLRILEVLQRDGRRAYADLGAEVGISGPSAHERVKKLEARRVITGYTATVDPVAAGFPILAFCWLTQAPGTIATDITPDLAAVDEVEECHHLAGEADYLLKLRARSTSDLERVLRRVQAIRHVFTTATDVVLSTTFERRPLARADETDSPVGA